MVDYAVGDVNSQSRGSGARANGGKPRLDLIPIAIWQKIWQGKVCATNEHERELISNLLTYLKLWQEGKTWHIDHAVYELQEFVEPCVRVFEYGIKKYAAWNWAKGMAWSVPLGCVLRHLEKILDGEDLDPESGQLHWGHVLCNLIMLQHYATNYMEGDDRPPQTCFAPPDSVYVQKKVRQDQVHGQPAAGNITWSRDPIAAQIKFDNEYDELLAIRRGGENKRPVSSEECVGI